MIETVAILGDTLCGWIAAAALARRLPRAEYRVLVIDTGARGDGLGDFAPLIAVPPALAAFHADLGLDDRQLVDGTGGGYALGTVLAGWRADGATGFLSYGETGAPLDGIAFRHLAARLRSAGQTVRFADHAIAALAAQSGRFDPAAPIDRGLHLDSSLYARMLRSIACNNGAENASAPLRDITTDGPIATHLTLTDGTTVEPFLLLDCTGTAPTDAPFEDWSHWLPCNRTATETVPADGAPPPFAQVDAQDAGWVMGWPLDGADVRVACSVDGAGRSFRQGALAAPWTGNRIALGAASCLLEPLHPTALPLLLNALVRLIQYWPADRTDPVASAAFNRGTTGEQARARDFVIAQYAAAGRPGAFWNARRTTELPDTVVAKRDLFAARGRLPMFDDEPFEEEDWAAMFDAMGVVPRRHDALADLLPIPAIERHLAAHRAAMIDRVRSLPPYAQVVARRRAVA
ncbi:tryptophan 7-halogenase [Sphingomonas prati]|uniref:Tryptophan halogenase n=1 Tax=Sphingomonas prati TaxID=1843237 RepID=A0A7W9BQ44_9SPHN|nr:tryptophan 7-halogenase [Sphingomonas prati]MBB5727871.1 tryptophan halogenase [Sphingomonas prati]GGE81482.1 tryptophan halogenase [Sphingomonas prati]